MSNLYSRRDLLQLGQKTVLGFSVANILNKTKLNSRLAQEGDRVSLEPLLFDLSNQIPLSCHRWTRSLFKS
ncbi:MAG: hypothetical protein Kow0049_19850 [Stanieria sp.]